jgi:tetratricopeptide (TPR) repeat protein
MRPTTLSRRRAASLSLAAALLSAGFIAAAPPASAQISGIERGGGVDRPYVPPRKRVNTTRVTSRPTRPPKGSTRPQPVPAVDDNTISAEAMKRYDAGRAALDKGNVDTAVKEFEAAIRLESKFVDALIDLGDAYFERVNLEDAVDAYQRALVLDKGNTDAKFRLGRASFARRDYDTALAEYNDVLKVRPSDPEAIYNIALTNKALKRYEDAIPYFERSIAASTKPFPEARINLSRCYYELGKLDDAEASARKAIEEAGPETQASANAWYALATALASKRDLVGAADALEHAIAVCKQCPDDMRSRFYLPLAQVFESRGERSRAADAYERFLQLAPFAPDYQIQEIREKISKLRKAG